MNLIRLFQCQSSLFVFPHEKNFTFLLRHSSDIESSLYCCIRGCRPYFSASATKEILDEFRPNLCPFDSAFTDAIRTFELFLPIHLPPELHDQGYK